MKLLFGKAIRYVVKKVSLLEQMEVERYFSTYEGGLFDLEKAWKLGIVTERIMKVV